jgi:alcohol dehydrogenase, propanol-preferring
MKAWRLEAGGPLVLRDVTPPSAPGAGRLIVRVAAVGICHSDVGFVDGTISSWLAPLPVTLGHEIAGVVTAVAPDVTVVPPGGRVGVRAGVAGAGVAFDGGFAEFVEVSQDYVVPLPDGLPFDLAAVATDAGKSSYHAMVCRGRVSEGTRTGVIGLGGLGDVATQIAIARGAVVHVAEIDPAKRQRARELGAVAVMSDPREFAAAVVMPVPAKSTITSR